MEFNILYRPAHTLAVCNLNPNETIRAEAGAMVSMTRNIQVQAAARNPNEGGALKNMFKGLKRMALGGESFFTNTYTAMNQPGHVSFAPKLTGDMVVHPLQGETLLIQGSSYVAAPDSVTIDTKFQGFKGLFSGESLFFLAASGHGPVLLNAFGAIESFDMAGEMIVDTGHIVAFTAGIQYSVVKASKGWIASFLSGEGLVLRLQGQGRVYVQSRNPNEYGSTVGRMLPPRSN
ncbi:MAG: TIGR00266 family protein [Deltaproteobacteria bacterium]|nr:TIGR00266 family protein [Deltaproteobacteria bacterium]